jgi:hypothetical protein
LLVHLDHIFPVFFVAFFSVVHLLLLHHLLLILSDELLLLGLSKLLVELLLH